MAHEIRMNKDFASRNISAWHQLGCVLNDAATWEDFVKAANAYFLTEKQQLFNNRQEAIDSFGIFRTDDNAFLGNVGKDYQIIQVEEAFQIPKMMTEHFPNVSIETMGVLGKGERVFALLNLGKEFEIAAGDKHKQYWTMLKGNNGTQSTIGFETDVRIVCNNTLRAAMSARNKKNDFKIKHTKSAPMKIEEVKKIILAAEESFFDLEDKLRELSKRIVSKESYMTVMVRLFGDIEKSTRAENKVLEIAKLFESNDNNAFPSIRGTSYNLLNAITEYTDHVAGVRITEGRKGMSDDTARAESALFGTGAQLKQNALEVIYDVTGSDKRISDVSYFDMNPNTPLLDSILSTMH